MAIRTYDAAVIGAGPGGYVAAIRLAQLGRRTALVERAALGGVCLNAGCIPSKALIAVANLVEELRGAARRGVTAEPRVDLATLRAFKDGVVRKLAVGLGHLERGRGVDVIAGTASFVSPRAVEVKGGAGTELVEAGAFVVATGAVPVELPALPFGPAVWSAKEALDLAEIPERLLIVGGGVVGLELGTAYAKLGARVTVVEAQPRLLHGIDPDAARLVAKGLRQRGVRILLGATPKALRRRSGSGSAVLVGDASGGEAEVECDRVLVAAGFRPGGGELGLEKLGVERGPGGFIAVDGRNRTSVPSIHAIGDACGPPFLAHRASREGELVAEAIAGMATRRFTALPDVVFTDPEIGQVGRPEDEARGAGHDPIRGTFALGALGRVVAMDRAEGFAKVVADRDSKRILGATFCGAQASELVAEATLAMELGATLHDVVRTVHAHPTVSEAFLEACRAALGEAIHALDRPQRPRDAA